MNPAEDPRNPASQYRPGVQVNEQALWEAVSPNGAEVSTSQPNPVGNGTVAARPTTVLRQTVEEFVLPSVYPQPTEW